MGFGNTNTNALPQQSTNPFGTNALAPAFNQPNNPTVFSCSPRNPFEQSQSQQSNNPFGRTNASTSGFFNTSGLRDTNGTAVKFTPVGGTDTTLNRGLTQTIQVRYWCINFMKEYEDKSMEELRFEDYKQGRKGPQQPSGFFNPPASGTLFPGTSTTGGLTTNQSNFFNKPFSFPNSNNNNNPFATNSTQFPTNSSIFNNQNSGFGPTQSNQNFFNQPKSLWTNPSSGFNPLTETGKSLFAPKPGFLSNNTNNLFKPTGFSLTPSSTNMNFNNNMNNSFLNQQKTSSLFQPNSNRSFPSTNFAPSLNYRPFVFSTPPSNFNNSFSNSEKNPVSLNQIQKSVTINDQILGLITRPFGDSTLLRNLQPSSGKAEYLAKSKSAFTVNKPMNRTQYKIATNSTLKIKPKMIGSGVPQKINYLDDDDSHLLETFQVRPSAKRLVLRAKRTSNNSQTDNEKSSSCEEPSIDKENHEVSSFNNDSRSSTSWLKVSVNRNKSQEENFDIQSKDSENFDDSIKELRPNRHLDTLDISPDEDSVDSFERISNSEKFEEIEELRDSTAISEGMAKKAKVKLQRSGYYTIPAIETLDEYVHEGTCIVPNFTVGRKGYGKVYFSECDVFGLNLDEIVHFRHKEVIIYPEDDKKPKIGEGLNRRAKVTLERVWPNDKSHKPITDAQILEKLNFEEKLKRVSEKHNTSFLEYQSKTGSWIFQVEHF